MLDRLLESGVRRKKSAWGGVASVVVHSAIIVLAVVATATGTPLPTFTHEAAPIIPLQPPADDRATGRPPRDGAGSTGTRTADPAIPTIDLPLPTVFDPGIPSTTLISASAGGEGTVLSEIGGAGSGLGVALGGPAVATDGSVDVPVRALVDRAPAYPEMLRAAGITGEVRVQFVVDTTGRAELSSVHVIESSHELFTRAVIASLRQARFTSGEVSGRRVRTLVERSFRFDIAGGAR